MRYKLRALYRRSDSLNSSAALTVASYFFVKLPTKIKPKNFTELGNSPSNESCPVSYFQLLGLFPPLSEFSHLRLKLAKIRHNC